MKKLLTVTCLAGLLSIPSVVFADDAEMPAEPELSPEMQGHLGDSHSGANWYGSLRVGVSSSSNSDLDVSSFGSRWGITGSSEVSEGLTAVYRFEQGLNSANATQGAGRQSYVGLTGGFGAITAGQFWSASYNTVGVITNKTYSQGPGGGGASLRIGNALSYAVSVGSATMQADVVMDARPNSIDQVDFGISVDVGEIGKIAFAHVRKPGYTTTKLRPYLDVEVTGKIEALTLAFTEKVTVAVPGVGSNVGGTSTTPAITLEAKTVAEIEEEGHVIQLPSNSTLLSLVYTTKTSTGVKDTVTNKDIQADADVTLRKVWVGEKEKGHTDPDLTNYTTIADKTDPTKSEIYHSGCLVKGVPDAAKGCVKVTQYTYDKDANIATATKEATTIAKPDEVNVASTVTLATGKASVTTDIPALDVTINGKTVETDITLTGKAVQKSDIDVVEDSRSNHIAAEATFGAIKGYIGYSERDTGGVKSDTTHFGISGSLGESGISYLIEANKEADSTPWALGLYKTLGGGASVNFEHGNNGSKGTSVAFVQVNF